MNCAIEVSGLSKSFGKVVAVQALELSIGPGEIYGFLGLNGAGKTTTIRALLGMIRPSQGSVRVLGQRVGPAGRGPWRRVGHLVEAPSAYPELTIRENLEIARRLHAISDRGCVSRAIGLLDLERYADRRTGSLSTGSLQRMALARALLHDPEVLILDEPANGLDPAGVVEIRQLLHRLAVDKGVTVFMSSHILTEVDRLATRIGIIHRGRLLEELAPGTLSDAGKLRVQVRPEKLALAVEALGAAGLHAMVDAEHGLAGLGRLPGLECARAGGYPPGPRWSSPHFSRRRAGVPRGSLPSPHRRQAVTGFRAAFWAESLKVRRSKIVLLTTAGFLMLPLVDTFLMYVLIDPERAREMGLIGMKAEMTAGSADWPTFLMVLFLGTAVAGGMLGAFVTAWVFGREISDHTAKEWLATPTPRETYRRSQVPAHRRLDGGGRTVGVLAGRPPGLGKCCARLLP